MGNLIYKHIYGNWTTPTLNTWKKELLDNAIQPIQQYSNTVGKNSSDSALIIDAMDLLYQKRLDASALFHPTATSRALPHACANRRCSCWVWESRKRHAPSLALVTSLSTLTFCTRRAPTPQRAKRRKTAKRKQGDQTSPKPSKSTTEATPSKVEESTKTQHHNNEEKTSQHQPQIDPENHSSSKNAIPVVSTTSPTRIPTDLISSRWKPLCAKSPKSSAAMMAGFFSLKLREHVLPDACPTSTHATSALKSLYPSSSSLSFFESKSGRESEKTQA